MSSIYSKNPLTIDEQVDLLKERGLVIRDEKEIIHYLNNISYFHLSSYFKHYQDEKSNVFYDEIDFDKILNLYIFDRKLRIEFLDALEKIERSLKARLTHVLSHSYGKFCINMSEYFVSIQPRINEELERSREVFLKTYKKKYRDEYYPIWMIMEVLSLGTTLNVLLNSPTRERKK